jgi:hypothetical protein
MAHRQETWICDACKRPACKGGCYYRPSRVVALLANYPVAAQTVGDPTSYRVMRTKVEANAMEGNWAVRADLQRALAHVCAATPNGPIIEQIVVLAYVGIPTPSKQGKNRGVSDSELGRLLDMDTATVAAYRMKGIRLMVECLNPDYDWDKEQR